MNLRSHRALAVVAALLLVGPVVATTASATTTAVEPAAERLAVPSSGGARPGPALQPLGVFEASVFVAWGAREAREGEGDDDHADGDDRDDHELLAHETRAAVVDRVAESPGIALTRLAAERDVSPSTLRYHVRRLADEELVTDVTINGRKRVFPADAADPLQRELAAAVDDPVRADVLYAVARHGPATVTELADEVDRAASTLSYHLDRLDGRGLVERERDGRRVYTSLAEDVRDSLTEA